MLSACWATHQTFAAYSKVEGFEPYIRSSPTLILLGSSEGPHIAAR
jgi:hypothetical protein